MPTLKGKGKANASVNRCLSYLGGAYRYAVSQDPPKLPRAITIQMLDESDNRRKGKFTAQKAELVASNLPAYMGDVARFGYQCGARASEIWAYAGVSLMAMPSLYHLLFARIGRAMRSH